MTDKQFIVFMYATYIIGGVIAFIFVNIFISAPDDRANPIFVGVIGGVFGAIIGYGFAQMKKNLT